MKLTVLDFYEQWIDAAKLKEQELIRNWNNPPELSSTIMYDDASVINLIADKLKFKHYSEYYFIDMVLYDEAEDRVPDIPSNQTWIRRIRVAFEHENFFNSGLFKEISHLLITHCDSRVLVSYPDNELQIKQQLKYLHEVISGVEIADEISKEASLLIIIGWKCNEEILWIGCVYKTSWWQLLMPDNFLWKNSCGLSEEIFLPDTK